MGPHPLQIARAICPLRSVGKIGLFGRKITRKFANLARKIGFRADIADNIARIPRDFAGNIGKIAGNGRENRCFGRPDRRENTAEKSRFGARKGAKIGRKQRRMRGIRTKFARIGRKISRQRE
jgi:hypothetical protein